MPDELKRRLRFLPEASQEEARDFLRDAGRFLGSLPQEKLRTFPPVSRIKWQLIREEKLDELVAAIRFERDNPSAFRVTGRVRPKAVIPGADRAALSGEVTRLRRSEMPLRARATELVWRDGVLVVRGYAYVANTPPGKGLAPRLAWLRKKESRLRLPLAFRTRTEPQATRDSKQALHCFDDAGFEIVIDPSRLRARGQWKPGIWQLTLALPAPGGYRFGSVGKSEVGTAGHSQARDLGNGARMIAGFTDGRLQITVETPEAEVVDHTLIGDAVRVLVRAPSDAPAGLRPTHLTISRKSVGQKITYPLSMGESEDNGLALHADVPIADLSVAMSPSAATEDFVTMVVLADGSLRRATVPSGFRPGRYPLPEGREIAVTTDGPGLLKLHDRVRQPVVDSLEWTPQGELLLAGEYSGPGESMRLVLRHGQRFEEHHLPLTCEDGRFTARILPDRMSSYEDVFPLRQGRWYLSLRKENANDHTADVPVKLRCDLVDSLPLSHRGAKRTYTVNRRFFDRIFLSSGPVLTDEERGGYRQRLLREVHTPRFKREPLREAVFYNSYGGKQFSDSPRAIYEEFVRRGVEVEHIWSVSDDQVALPPGVRAVEWHSTEWYEALARSRYVVTNVGLGDWYESREGQCVVQTWHGTPLKKIGADLLGTPKANPAYIASLPHRFRQFTYVVSPNAFTTPIMRNAFQCEGEILESGYPRNDVFHRADRAEIAGRVRATLGIPENKKVVLYAPTWRDDQRHTATKFKLDLRVDLAAAQETLGEDHVFLFRKHPKILDAVPGAGQGFVWDVSAYPDIADLYLIADILVTDYSSVLFDFAHSGKPMLFFTYDLEHYRDTLRGFYFDFTERAPGPLLKSSAELVDAIRDIEVVRDKYADKYQQFVKDFCEPSDGKATARVVDRMLGVSG
ncbi:hypothetical protein GCM10009716_48160 [Streptomyces sodiiphilus]|uniref:Glycosyl transferase n=1 Tax=Streptomyces sodiiphilus TaxID=226217 RepID=A0ABP5B7N3_9ACTN